MTSQSPNERFRNGNGYKSSPHFFHAIQKYGWNNFDHMILAQNLSKDEAIRKEIEIIALYRSNDAKLDTILHPAEKYVQEKTIRGLEGNTQKSRKRK